MSIYDNNRGLIQFRHPLARGDDGKGKVVRRGVLKLDPFVKTRPLE